jgi:hypothetical protein
LAAVASAGNPNPVARYRDLTIPFDAPKDNHVFATTPSDLQPKPYTRMGYKFISCNSPYSDTNPRLATAKPSEPSVMASSPAGTVVQPVRKVYTEMFYDPERVSCSHLAERIDA